ncbi:DUF3899 domain-containing protein [Cerasibacillus terrae]|uniref:DUF3899 domain-containing protein n=1 Tax=Cerasibacillus terrae TaxID=2498845 RepID=A0A5C8NZK3_9BACI|nr:DUF3899 domain-containing protein [Cerasibacillus terrae]TXL66561.1 DUF3899 domain-containing protein [Cerasibacillus terrae]
MFLKKLSIWLGSSQVAIILSSFVFYKEITLLSYINVAFVIGFSLLLIAMGGYVVKGRFFDIVFYSFQHTFGKMENKKRRPLSKLVPQYYKFPFITGIVLLSVVICLLIFYML